ncbi:hypothetical protein QE152_g26010 [Popillia japonica]|uniref:Uncharacterized protein n=1 Tax=Popillia japonica TaxID=7064 RepID=A0AAW1K048_POPJA
MIYAKDYRNVTKPCWSIAQIIKILGKNCYLVKLYNTEITCDEIVDLVEDPVDSEVDSTRTDDSASNIVESDESNQANGSNCSEGGQPSSSFLIKNRPDLSIIGDSRFSSDPAFLLTIWHVAIIYDSHQVITLQFLNLKFNWVYPESVSGLNSLYGLDENCSTDNPPSAAAAS